MGNGPEDILSESTVKSGFVNKPTITNESNTARPVIWGPLKHKSGLQTLSSLFVAILEKRQASGRLTTTSTFKPPPRVSLTNTKREAWLSDLANPACALRRFNRTIPYGINGKGLLEQCLAKEIPTARAIWLAKCIGANELRTLKRKGIGGALGIGAEQKWVREWTMHVEQFMEATISARTDQTWKEKVQYVVRLTYHLYIEQLLDEDHFLDWIMGSFEASTTERIPLWLVHLQLYWRSLVATRKRGRRLAEAVCNSLHTLEADNKNSDLLAPISQRLKLLLGTLAVSHSACLIMPKHWSIFEKTIRSLGTRTDLALAIPSIVERNNRLAKPLWEQNPRSTASPRRRAFGMLDTFDADMSVPDLCSNMYSLLSSVESVILLALEWCSSPYRQGVHRVYLTSRILRRFGMSGADIEGYVLSFLMDPPASSSIQVANVVKVVAELVRAKSFAVLKVLRAVIARGAMTDSEHNPQAASRLRQLVRGIPTTGLPQHVGDLQQNLLREAASPPPSSIFPSVAALKALVNRTVFGDREVMWSPAQEEHLHSLSVAQKFEVSAHIRTEIFKLSKSAYGAGSQYAMAEDRSLTPGVFAAARDILEKVEDYPLLADVVGVCLRQSNGEMLASVADTIHQHSQTFASIGALQPLTTQAIERYHGFRNEVPLEKVYLKALLGLIQSTKGDQLLIHKLTYDLARCDQHNAMAMCSPASDNALDLAATSSLETEEEIERILASGTTMDEQSISRVFSRIAQHLTTGFETRSKFRVQGEWFARLRAFDEATFDSLADEWVAHVLHVATVDVCCYVLPFLLGSSALAYEQLSRIENSMRASHDLAANLRCKLSVVMLTLYLLPASGSRSESLDERYRFKLSQRDFGQDHVQVILKQLGYALAVLDDQSRLTDMEHLHGLLPSGTIHDFVLRCAVEHKKELQEQVIDVLKSQPHSQAGTSLLKSIVETHLDQQGPPIRNLSTQEKIPRLVRMVDELSLPLCQLEMQLLLQAGGATANEDSGSIEMATSLFEAIMRSPESERPPWLDLVDGLDAPLLQRLRALAEIQILKLVNECCPHARSGGIEPAQLARVRSLLRRLLYVVHRTVNPQPRIAFMNNTAMPQSTPGDSDGPTVDRFGAVREVLARHFMSDASDMKPLSHLTSDLVCTLLDALLHLLVVRKYASEGSKSASAADVSSLLPILFAIFSSQALTTSRSTLEFLYDTVSYLSDDLTDESRAGLAKSEGGRWPGDARVTFILGTSGTATDAWLGLVTSLQVPSANTQLPSATPTMTPQQAQNRFGGPRPSALHPGARPPMPGMQRSPSGLGVLMQGVQKQFNAPVPYHLRRWEMLQDPGSNAMGMANDTAISLGLLGARRV